MKHTRTFGLGAVVTLAGITGIAAACGGASATEITDGTSSSGAASSSGETSSSGATSSSSGGTTSTSSGGSSGGSSSGGSSSGGSSGTISDGGKKDAAKDADADAAPATCPANTKITAADLDKDPGWNPAAVPAQACTANEIAQFGKNLDDVTIKTWSGLATGLSTTCADCIITDNTQKAWGPIVVIAGTKGDEGFYNFGACFGRVENEACGRDVQYNEFCIDAQCDDCVTGHAQCVTDVDDVGGACASFVQSLQTDCKSLTASGKKCNDIVDAAKTLCGPNADAGL